MHMTTGVFIGARSSGSAKIWTKHFDAPTTAGATTRQDNAPRSLQARQRKPNSLRDSGCDNSRHKNARVSSGHISQKQTPLQLLHSLFLKNWRIRPIAASFAKL